jgi:hypothetical protein
VRPDPDAAPTKTPATGLPEANNMAPKPAPGVQPHPPPSASPEAQSPKPSSPELNPIEQRKRNAILERLEEQRQKSAKMREEQRQAKEEKLNQQRAAEAARRKQIVEPKFVDEQQPRFPHWQRR